MGVELKVVGECHLFLKGGDWWATALYPSGANYIKKCVGEFETAIHLLKRANEIAKQEDIEIFIKNNE